MYMTYRLFDTVRVLHLYESVGLQRTWLVNSSLLQAVGLANIICHLKMGRLVDKRVTL